MNEESTYGNSAMIDFISELMLAVKQTKSSSRSADDSYENRVWNGEFDNVESSLKLIEKNLRLLGRKHQDIEAEKEVYVNLVPAFGDIIMSLLHIVRSRHGMNMASLAGNVSDKALRKLHDRQRRGISVDKTIYNDDALAK